MKNHLNAHCTSRHLLNLALTLSLALPLPSLAASVALASSPLATASTSTVMPNLMFMLDDSGSMDWDYMPDDALNFHNGKYGFNSNHCNGVYYNPKITYTPPVDSTGANLTTPFSDANGNQPFTKAETDGYNTGTTVNLNTGFTGGSGTGQSGNILTPGPAFYYTYSGTQTTGVQMDFHNTSSIFYNECISAIGLTTKVDGVNPVNTVFTIQTLATTPTTTITINTSTGPTATITVSGGVSTPISNIKVGVTTITSGLSSGSSNNNNEAIDIAAKIAAGGYSASASSNVVTINGPSTAAGLLPVVTKSSGSDTFAVSAFTSPSVSSIKVNGVELLLSGSAVLDSNTTTTATNIAAKINATGYTATASGNVVTITGPASADGYTPVITNSGSMTYTTAQFPNITDPVQLTNFANWYTYYSTRMLMMKTGVGQAFSPISNKYRVGFMTMNNNVSPDIVEIAPFDTTQKSAWYSKLYASNPGNSTPLREALSHVGQMYAHKFGDYTYYTATITVGGSGSTVVNSITVNGTETMAGTSTGNTSTSTVATSVAAQINILDPSDYGATVSSNKITITGPVSANGSVPFITNNGGGMTFTATAFTPTTVHAQLNGITPKDPVQYSCQQNFVILSTDGYWNGATTYDLSTPNQPVGNQDGTAPRPMYDGGLFTKTTSQTYQKQTQITQTASQLQKRTTQIQSSTSKLQSQTSQLQASTSTLQTQTSQLQAQTSSLQSQTSQLQTQTSSLQSQTSQLQAQTSSLQSQTSQLQSSTSALQSQTSQLQSSTSTLQSQTSQLQSSTSTLQGTVSRVLLKCSNTTAVCGAAPATGVPNASWVLATSCTTATNTQCARVSPSPTLVRNVTTTCNTAGSINNSSPYTATNSDGGYVYSSCTYTGWSAGVGTSACSAVAQSGSSPYTVLTATQCNTVVTSPYANAGSCTVNAVPNGSGNTTQCQYTGWSAGVGVSSCVAVAQSSAPNYTVGTAKQCNTVVTSPYANAGSCTVNAVPNGSGNTTQCQYTAYSAGVGVSSCIAVAQSSAPNYTVATAKQCNTVVTSPYANAGSCTVNAVPNGSGNTTQCQYTAYSGWTGISSCTAAAQSAGPTNYTVGTARNCQTVVTSAFANAGSCTVNAVPNGSGNTTQCQYTAYSGWAGTSACTSAAQSAGPTNYTVGTATKCQTVVTSAYANAGSCTANATPNGSGNTTQCQYTAYGAWAGTSACAALAQSSAPNYTVGTATQCQTVVSSPYANAASCTATSIPNGSGNTTQCQYTAYSAWANASSCTTVAQSSVSPYTAGTATQCQTTDTGWVGAASCANSGPTNGLTVYCNNPNVPVVTKTYVQNTCSTTTSSCTSPFTTSSCITTSCTTATTQPTTLVGSCIQGNSGAPNYIQTTCSTTTLSTSSNASSCTPGNSGSPSYITTTCTGGAGGTSDTLADVAMYYYQTDLRDSSLDNCTGAPSTDFPSGTDVCQNNVFINNVDKNTQQHLVTYTLGLGARGRMVYTSKDYMNDTSGDFYSVYSPNPPTLGYTLADSTKTPPICSWQANGTICNWPIPSSGSIANIDDLWHAAVNGRGTYFSATDPAALSDGLSSALSSITARKGAAAAAATSTLNPVAGNNFAYVASYTTVKWIGNLEARSINTTNGVIAQTATWCEENITADTCAAPGSVIASISGSSTVYNCVTPNSTATNCTSPSVFDPVTNNCSLQMALACTGTLPTMVGPITDTRTIYTANSTGTGLINFDAAYAAANPTNFSAAHINTLSQWSALTATQQAAAAGVNLINFLRGQNGYEDRATNLVGAVDNRFYRAREAVLGDALESQPSYIGAPTFSYSDTGYSAFVTAEASRPGTVYMGTNDGMLHAFDANTGIERWAYVPSVVIPNMWKLADFNYGTQHVNFVNGSPIISDFYCTVNCGGTGGAPSWRTILVGGLSGGGREYYALDITDPTAPTLLWEFIPAQDANLGYSFGLPIVTKMANGTWIVLVTSGYDNGTLSGDAVTPNSPAGNGQGYLYVLDARTGAIIKKITTGVGSAITPSGLAKIAAWNNAPSSNEASYTYGGDLLGNVWRFDINASGSPLLFAILKDPFGIVQPVTTTPTLGLILGKRVIFVGTGKYLESSGITHDDLKDTQVQSLYAIKDDDATATLVNPRSYTAIAPLMVQQTITPNGSVRTGSTNAVDFNVDRGWFVDFPDTGERVNIDSKLVLGALLVPTIVPSNTVCSPGGYGWLNYFDYLTGQPITDGTGLGAAGTNTNVSAKYDASIVGMNILYIAGKPVVEVVTSDNPTPTIDKNVIIPPSNATFTGIRMQWRELIP